MSLKCNRCGKVWPDELGEQWGSGESSGYGPEPVCVNVVQDKRTGAGAVCRGGLTSSRAKPDGDED